MRRYPRVLPVGDAAATLELGDAIDPNMNARVRAIDGSLSEAPFPGLLESVPTYRALLVVYDPRSVGFDDVRDDLLRRAASVSDRDAAPGALRTIPARYGGEDGPDLAAVARARGLTEAEVVALHTSVEYTAFMLGFTPGFAYLGLLPEALATPRLATPRVRVSAGSVAVAGRQTAVYPVASPGGWSLLGRTSIRLFDPATDPPALILPGDRVRFLAVPDLPETPRAAASAPSGPAGLEVLEGGLLTTVQDGGRRGFRRLGVGWAGPMDAGAHRAANRVLGNLDDAAALECTVAGPTLRFLTTTHFGLVGADLGAVLERADLGAWPVPLGVRVRARTRSVLRFTERRSGCRAYLAFAGGIDVPAILGSRATDLAGGFGGCDGRALRAGDVLALGPSPPGEPAVPHGLPPEPASMPLTLRVVLGPQDDHFTDAALGRLLEAVYEVGAASDRVGCRLSGPRLEHGGPTEIVSDGLVPGAVQVPPDGQPIVMMADAPTTGGYPKIATVLRADLPRLAQLLPGEGRMRFEAVSIEAATRAR